MVGSEHTAASISDATASATRELDASASATRELDASASKSHASASKGRQTQWLAWFQLEL